MAINVRTYKGPEDIPVIVGIINAADAVDQKERGMSERELREALSSPSAEPHENVLIAEVDSAPVGCGFVRLREGDPAQGTDTNFYTDGVVLPDWRRRGIGSQLMEGLEARAISRMRQIKTENVYSAGWCEPDEGGRIALFEKFGLKRIRYFFEMIYDSPEYPDEPEYPAGITARTFERGEDEEVSYYARNESFRDHWSFAKPRKDDWLHWLSGEDFDPSLFLLAFDESQDVAGICWNAVYKEMNQRTGRDEGWIDLLGVLRPYRRKGLGRALLLESMRLLRDRGMKELALGVDADSPTGATRLYESVGFRVRKTQVAYRKVLRGKPDEPMEGS
jgi:mycothiol synthase